MKFNTHNYTQNTNCRFRLFGLVFIVFIISSQISNESQEVREETSRQLDQSVVKDWNYQVEFNKRRKAEEELQKDVYSTYEKQVNFKSHVIIHLFQKFTLWFVDCKVSTSAI